MKLLLLADRMESGGAETHILTLARGLLRSGHTVGLFSCGGSIADRLEQEGVRCRTVPKIGRNPFAFLAAKAALAEEIEKNGYEILHAHTRMTALLARQICNPYMRKSAKTPSLVVTAHAKFRADGLFRLLSVWGEETIAVSEDLRAYLADRYRLPVERITVIPNGIDENKFFPAAKPGGEGAPGEKAGNFSAKTGALWDFSAEKDGLGEKGAQEEFLGKPGNFLGGKGAAAEKPVEILFVSRLDADCSLGAELLCKAVQVLDGREIPPFRVTIAGQGSEFSRLCELAGKANLFSGRRLIRVVRPRGEDELIGLYRRSEIFVGASRAALEASFCGCAVLLCGNEGYGGILSPGRPDLAASNLTCRGKPLPTEEKLVRDLAYLLANPDRRRANAEATRGWAREIFSAKSALRATEAVYQTLLWRRGKGEKIGTQKYKNDRVQPNAAVENGAPKRYLRWRFCGQGKKQVGGHEKEKDRGQIIWQNDGQRNRWIRQKVYPPRVVIGGYAGCGNLGDDAVLQGILSGLWQNGISPRAVTVLSGRPRRDSIRFGVRCVHRMNLFSILFALLRADLFVSGGGTLLQNRTGRCSLFYYLSLLRLARLCSCRTVVLGGLGDLSGLPARRSVKNELERCAAILLRDEHSAAFARGMGLKNPRLAVGADSAFLLPEPPPLRAAFLVDQLVGDLKKPFLCVCPCGGVSTVGLSALLRAPFAGFYPVFLLCDPSRDEPSARHLQARFGGVLYAPRDAGEAMALFRSAALVLSSRLHPLILSVRVGARCVCFSGGDVKLSAFCQSAEIPLFPADVGLEILPSAAVLFSLPLPNGQDFCRKAAKDLAILSRMVYNRGEGPFAAKRRTAGRTLHEKRATGGSAPPDHH